jgi:hypothetical protein
MRDEALMTKKSEATRKQLLRDIEAYACGETRSPLAMMRASKLDNWSVNVRRRGKEFILVVSGDVTRHHELPDGENISVGAVAWFDRKARFVRSHNRLYALGEPAGPRESEV